MPHKTLREQYIAGLLARGETKVKETRRFTVYTRAKGGLYFVGTHGSLRAGMGGSSTSVPVADSFKKKLIDLGNQPVPDLPSAETNQ